MAGAHRDAPHDDPPDAAQDVRRVVAAAGARPGDDEHEVRASGRIADRGCETAGVVGQDRRAHGATAGLAGLGLEHDRVRVGELADRELRRGRAQLVARRQDRDDRRAVDREPGVAGGGGERQVHRPEPTARREHELPGRDVLADAADVRAGGDRRGDQHGVVAEGDALARDHRVAPGGERVAGVDDVEPRPGQPHRIGLARRARVGAGDGDAVHRRGRVNVYTGAERVRDA